MTPLTPNRGVSLVEMLVYVSVLVIVAIAAVYTIVSLRDVFERNRVERELANAATSALERITRDIRDAEAVGAGSVLDVSPGTLVLDKPASPAEVSFYINNGQVYVSEDGTSLGPLTPTSVSVDALTFFHHTQVGGVTDLVRVELTLSVSSKYASTTETFYSSAVMRGSYE